VPQYGDCPSFKKSSGSNGSGLSCLALAAIKPEGFLLIEFGAPVYPGYSTDLTEDSAKIRMEVFHGFGYKARNAITEFFT
jgi:hypothetical protein